jgi:hypothetical protein
MSANLEQAILKKLQALPDNKQVEVLALVDEMLKETHEPSLPKNVRPIWEIIQEISSQAPPGTWDDVPTDGSVNHDHYLYGAPKRCLPLVPLAGNPISQETISSTLDAE